MFLIEAIVSIFVGCFLGVFSGLAPGIHVNTVALVFGSFAAKGDLNFALLVVAMTISHSFLDFVPSILLGAPDAENFLSALPGHRMLLKGKAFKAIKLTVVGGLFGTIIAIALLPFYTAFVLQSSSFLQSIIPIVLLSSVILELYTEKGVRKKIIGFFVVLLSAVLGLLALNSFSNNNNLFALVSGFFGVSTILFSLKEKHSVIFQETKQCVFDFFQTTKASFFGTIASAIVSLFPAIGPSQAAFIVKNFSGRIKTENYLVLLGAINTASSVFSFFVLYLIGKARTGTAVAVKNVLVLQQEHVLPIIAAILIAVGFSVVVTDIVSRKAINEMQHVDYALANKIVLLIIVGLVFLFSGLQGIFLLVLSTIIGLAALFAGIKRSNCMAFLVFPTLAYYLRLFP